MEKLLEIAEKEWAVVSGAPITIAVIALAIWAVVSYLYKERLDSAKELLALKSQQLSEIQERTGAENPEDVSARLAKVEAELSELGETDFVAIYNGAKKISDLPDLP